jgi:hypothetical protein
MAEQKSVLIVALRLQLRRCLASSILMANGKYLILRVKKKSLNFMRKIGLISMMLIGMMSNAQQWSVNTLNPGEATEYKTATNYCDCEEGFYAQIEKTDQGMILYLIADSLFTGFTESDSIAYTLSFYVDDNHIEYEGYTNSANNDAMYLIAFKEEWDMMLEDMLFSSTMKLAFDLRDGRDYVLEWDMLYIKGAYKYITKQ